jgi:hypothetical protein
MNQSTNSELKTMPRYTTMKDSVVTENATNKENTQIREINFCLVPCEQCTGIYVDSINGTLLRIICSCPCHSKKQMVLESVEGALPNASNTIHPSQEEILR